MVEHSYLFPKVKGLSPHADAGTWGEKMGEKVFTKMYFFSDKIHFLVSWPAG